jgi:hypothetical protein
MQIHQSQDESYQRRRAEIAQLDIEYDSLEEFEDKITRDQFVKWAAMINQWNILGLLLKFGYFDPETLFEYLHATGPIVHWEKFKDVIVWYRERNRWHSFCSGMEYLAEEMIKYRDKQEHKYLSNNR